MRLVLQRQVANAICTQGEMSINGNFAAWTLEQPTKDFPSDYHCVEAGIFPIRLYESPHFGRLMPLLVDPPHEWIEIHWGNWVRDSHGCILVGSQRGTNMIYNTQLKFDELFPVIQAAVNSEGCDIQIIDPVSFLPPIQSPPLAL